MTVNEFHCCCLQVIFTPRSTIFTGMTTVSLVYVLLGFHSTSSSSLLELYHLFAFSVVALQLGGWLGGDAGGLLIV